MNTKTVSVSMGVTIPHPCIQYSNLRFDVSYSIRLQDGETYDDAQVKLRTRAEHFLQLATTQAVQDCHRREQKRRAAIQMQCEAQNASRDSEIPF